MLGGTKTERSRRKDSRQEGELMVLINATSLPLVRQFFSNHDRPDPLLYPVLRPALQLVDHHRAFDGDLGILEFLDPLVCHLREPALESLGLRRRNRLDD